MTSLIHERCFNHDRREAVARCPECGGFFCRECVTEHEERVVCAVCLKKLVRRSAAPRGWWQGLVRVAQFGLGLLICWLCFYHLGRVLLALPSSFHEGTLWTEEPAREEP